MARGGLGKSMVAVWSVLLLLPVLVLLVPASGPSAAANHPEVTIDLAARSSAPAGEIELTGTASNSITAVWVTVIDRNSRQWLGADGSFGTYARLPTDRPTSTRWALSVELPPGSYGIIAMALDSQGQLTPRSERPWRRLDLFSSPGGSPSPTTTPATTTPATTTPATSAPATSTAPPPTLAPGSSPLVETVPSGTRVAAGGDRLRGTAVDDSGVVAVGVAIRERFGARRWLQPDGSWAGAYRRVGATLSAPGAARTDWSLELDLAPGSYGLHVVARDDRGQLTRPADRTWTLIEARTGITTTIPTATTVPSTTAPTTTTAPPTTAPTTSVAPTSTTTTTSVAPTSTTTRTTAAPTTTSPTTTTAPTGPVRHLSILFGRSQFGLAHRCQLDPRAFTLLEVADFLSARGIAATGTAAIGHIDDDPGLRSCPFGVQMTSSWNDLDRLADEHGWTLVGDSQPLYDADGSLISLRPVMRGLSPAEQQRQSCGSREVLEQRGFEDTWGLFAFPGGVFDQAAHDEIVTGCYALSRRYHLGTNYRWRVASERVMRVKSVDGGYCADTTLPCHSAWRSNPRWRPVYAYNQPQDLLDSVLGPAGTWKALQFYRLVEGQRLPGETPDDAHYWDCTADDPSQHWTSRGEIYCATDFRWIIDNLPDDVELVDPTTMAQRWGLTDPRG